MREGVRLASQSSVRFSGAAVQLSCKRLSCTRSKPSLTFRISDKTLGFICSQNSVMVWVPNFAIFASAGRLVCSEANFVRREPEDNAERIKR
jgi:hypothetical protein